MQPVSFKHRFDVMFWLPPTNFGAAEGLVVLLADLVIGLSRVGVKTHLHVSERHKPSLLDGLLKNGVHANLYQIVEYSVAPLILRAQNSSSRNRTQTLISRLHLVREQIEKLLVHVASRANIWHVAVLLIVSLPLVPLVLIASILLSMAKRLWGMGGRVVRPTGQFKTVLRRVRTIELIRDSYVAARNVESSRLARAINRLDEVSAVFVPFCFCGEALSEISKPKIVVFPDATPMRFPTRFIDGFRMSDVQSMRSSINQADSVICYSREIADNQLSRFFHNEIMLKPVHVIPQGFFNLPNKQAALLKKIKFENKFKDWCSFVPEFKLDEIKYVVYPSVDRPHKNSLTLLRATEKLLRVKKFNIKYITTSHYVSNEARNFIIQKRMFLDALYTPTLDQESLEWLIAHAQVVVHPSLAEGGDIFNFSRAVSVGVPALLADIPVTREMFDRWEIAQEIYEPWLFQATDSDALARLIESTIENRSVVVAAQQKVLERLLKYDYEAMASRYYEVYATTTKATPSKQLQTINL